MFFIWRLQKELSDVLAENKKLISLLKNKSGELTKEKQNIRACEKNQTQRIDKQNILIESKVEKIQKFKNLSFHFQEEPSVILYENENFAYMLKSKSKKIIEAQLNIHKLKNEQKNKLESEKRV